MVMTEAPAAADAVQQPDRVIYRAELCAILGVQTDTITRYLRLGKLPRPDVSLSLRTFGWRASTLRQAGVGVL